MEENKTENEYSTNEQVMENTETPTPSEGENDNVLKTALAQKDHFKEKTQKLEAQLKELQGKIPQSQGQQGSQDPRDVVRLAKALEGFSEDETEFIYRNAKGNDINKIIEASKDDWVKTAIEARREKINKENKVPSPSNPLGTSFQEKSFLDIKNMSDAEFDAYQRELIERANSKRAGGMGL